MWKYHKKLKGWWVSIDNLKKLIYMVIYPTMFQRNQWALLFILARYEYSKVPSDEHFSKQVYLGIDWLRHP